MASAAEMSRSFGAAAAAYEVGRPSYPVESVGWMLEPVPHASVIADMGAGTGKLTAVVRAASPEAEVVAVDPDAQMLATLRSVVAGVQTREGTGEEAPFGDGELDAAVFGQSWHWVDPEAGSAEMARVLRPGGVLGLIWNIRDDEHAWVRRMSEIMHISHAEQALAMGRPDLRAPFVEVQERRFAWSRPMTREQLFAMARSRSYLITAAPDELARIEAKLGDLFDEVGAVGDRTVDLPYVTSAFRAVRPS